MNAFVQKFLTFDKKVIHVAAAGVITVAGYFATHPALVTKVAAAVASYPTSGIAGVATAIILALYSQSK